MQDRSFFVPALALGLLLGPAVQAGIMRDVLEDLHIVKTPPPAAPAPGEQTPPFQGFACCNLHYDGRAISDTNYAGLPMIPAGTPIEVVSYDKHKANIKVDGKPLQLSQDKSAEIVALGTWVNQVVRKDDPRPHIRTYPAAVQEAIREGKVTLGMTREQAIVAVGYPLPNETITLDAPVWRIYHARREPFDLNFKADGALGSVSGDDSITSVVVYQPQKSASGR
ncbi:MAG TPA: hypothetical protein VK803_08725 [Steroidobacteraceae bacterium]|jgi:hypothetical protein|nr:hypothetical protein [Steroidobacteraceae bacterium]